MAMQKWEIPFSGLGLQPQISVNDAANFIWGPSPSPVAKFCLHAYLTLTSLDGLPKKKTTFYCNWQVTMIQSYALFSTGFAALVF